MGDCQFCGQPAGFLRKKHAECEARHVQGSEQMVALARSTVAGGEPIDALEGKLSDIARSTRQTDGQALQALIRGWELEVDRALEDGVLSVEEEKRLISFQNRFSLEQSTLDRTGAFSRVAKAAVLRDLLEGKVPNRIKVNGALPFNFQKGETLIWLFNSVRYLESRTRTHYEGRSQGVSLRIMKGVYYRTGTFRGYPVQTMQMAPVDTGALGVTTRHIYFAGPMKSFRITLNKIVSYTPYSDGVGVQRDAMTAKPQVFITGDGWFTYNLLMNLGNL
jgi:hypothetical protein